MKEMPAVSSEKYQVYFNTLIYHRMEERKNNTNSER